MIQTVSPHSQPSRPTDTQISQLLALLHKINSRMNVDQIKSSFASVPGLEIQNGNDMSRTEPFWGIFKERVAGFKEVHLERVKRIINLDDFGDVFLPEKSFFALPESDFFAAAGHTIRSIKVKGISPHLLPVALGQRRHLRNSGYGNVPYLEQNVGPTGERTATLNMVGQPYGGKIVRTTFNELILTECQLISNQRTMVPLAAGFLQNQRLCFKGEPIAFLVLGLPSPSDRRVSDGIFESHNRLSKAVFGPSTTVTARTIGHALNLEWPQMHARLSRFLGELAQQHRSGFIHGAATLGNIGEHENDCYFVDWEASAHADQLSKEQFLGSAASELLSALDYCTQVEFDLMGEFVNSIERLYGVTISPRPADQWIRHYFAGCDLHESELAKLDQLFPLTSNDPRANQFIDLIQPILARTIEIQDYGAGQDWSDLGIPFEDCDTLRSEEVPHEHQTVEFRLFVPFGLAHFGDTFQDHPHQAIKKVEEDIHAGEFDAARAKYLEMLSLEELAPYRNYLLYNVAVIYFRERQDALGLECLRGLRYEDGELCWP